MQFKESYDRKQYDNIYKNLLEKSELKKWFVNIEGGLCGHSLQSGGGRVHSRVPFLLST